jgi:hypothetical protein
MNDEQPDPNQVQNVCCACACSVLHIGISFNIESIKKRSQPTYAEAESVKGIPAQITHHHFLISLIIMVTGIMGMVIGTATFITPIR